MPRSRTHADFILLYNHILRNRKLFGDSKVSTLPQIGEYFTNRMHIVAIITVNDLLRYLTTLNTRVGVYDKLTRILQNERSGEAIAFRNSPIITDGRGKTVVADFNKYAYVSIRALMHVLCDMSASQRRSFRFTHTINKRVLPPEYPKVSVSGKYCTAHYDDEDACKSTGSYCKWVPPKGRTGSNCIPRSANVASTPGVGATIANSRSRAGAAPKLTQTPLVSTGLNAVMPRKRGRYVVNWRVPTKLRDMAMS